MRTLPEDKPDKYAKQKRHILKIRTRAKDADRMQPALEQIVAKLEGNTKSLANELREIARKGLEG